MFENIVVGIDGYERGLDAAALASVLTPRNGEVTLVYVELLQERLATGGETGPAAERQELGLERLARLRTEAHLTAEIARVQAPSVRRGLHEFAAGRDADLIVITASGRNDIERMVLGDDVSEVLAGAPCAVAVTPTRYAARPPRMTSIGVGYDGSEESEDAVALAKQLAADHDGTVSAFEAVTPRAYARDIWNVEGEIDDDVKQARHQIAELGGIEPYAASANDAVEGLRRYAAGVDLLILGAPSSRHAAPRPYRSTAQRLADDPASPLLVLAPTTAHE